jgi:hypothetical protein
MIYRKQSPTPPRMLLRIVGTAGAGTLLSVAACGSPSPEVVGSAPGSAPIVGGTSSDAAADSASYTVLGGVVVNPSGSVACPDDGSVVLGCPVIHPADASDDATDHGITGIVACPPDASWTQGCPILTGLVVSPTDASDDVIFHGIMTNPGDSG